MSRDCATVLHPRKYRETPSQSINQSIETIKVLGNNSKNQDSIASAICQGSTNPRPLTGLLGTRQHRGGGGVDGRLMAVSMTACALPSITSAAALDSHRGKNPIVN